MRLAGPIRDPAGWLIGLALPQHQRCGDVRCDDRVLLDSGQDCPRCEEKQADRRDQRRAVAAAVDAAMPHASETERRAAAEQQLHQDVTARAWAKAYEWEQVRARQAAAKARAEAAAARPADDVVTAPVAAVVLPAPRAAAVVPAPEQEPVDLGDDQELVLEDLTFYLHEAPTGPIATGAAPSPGPRTTPLPPDLSYERDPSSTAAYNKPPPKK